jgi:diguanylate cyclase
VATRADDTSDTTDLFARIGAFLAAQRLTAAPAHYALAYRVATEPDGATARTVAALTEGGVRLNAGDLARLGVAAAAGAAVAPVPDPVAPDAIARAAAQVDGFADMVRTVHAETNDFGRDLMRSAADMQAIGARAGAAEVARLTAAMIERVRHAEARMASAQAEADRLRAALAQAQGSARTDPLTDLPNRRGFDEAFAALAADAAVTVAICDVDHFKRVNDAFGHAVGDRVLRAVARLLAGECDCAVARWGGEEFALLVAGDAAAATGAMLDRARDTLGARRLRVRETGEEVGRITFSAGVATGLAGEGRGALMERADAALYRAKQLGRARTVIAP